MMKCRLAILSFDHPAWKRILLSGKNDFRRKAAPDESRDPVRTQSQTEWAQVLHHAFAGQGDRAWAPAHGCRGPFIQSQNATLQ
jgi:hypothetical protein